MGHSAGKVKDTNTASNYAPHGVCVCGVWECVSMCVGAVWEGVCRDIKGMCGYEGVYWRCENTFESVRKLVSP